MKTSTTGMLAACLVALTVSVASAQNDPTLLLKVVQVNGSPHTGDPATVDAAPGDIITLEIRVRDFSPTGLALVGFQAAIAYSTYFNSVDGDVLPLDFATTTDLNGYCSAGSGVPGDHNALNAYVDPYQVDYVFYGFDGFPAVASNTCDYWFSGAFFDDDPPPVAPQDGTDYYCGTLRLEVSSDAAGTFDVGFDLSDLYDPVGPDNCYLTREDSEFIEGVQFETVAITVPSGACCVETPSEACTITNESTCTGTWMEGIDCPAPDDCPCLSNPDCDDDNFCTSDLCDDHVCTYTLTYNEATHCCTPATGSTVPISDGRHCTIDTCDPLTGIVTHTVDVDYCLIDEICRDIGEVNSANDCEACDPNEDVYDWSDRPAGSLCDDAQPCTGTGAPGIGVDECDGWGVCVGVDDPDCHDICTEAFEAVDGANVSNNADAGPDYVEASCQPNSNHDVWWHYTALCHGVVTMDTLGTALIPTNNPVITVYGSCGGGEIACNDNAAGLQASVEFSTTAGGEYWIRVAGYADNVGDIVLNIDPVNDCMIGDTCYEEGYVNPENDCEACLPAESTTTWSPRAIDTACGSQSDGECDHPDTCDGAGVCLNNYEPEDTPCGDPGSSECDNPDSCSAAGICLTHHEPVDTPCGDPTETDCDSPDSCDGNGACGENIHPDGSACTPDTNDCTLDECASGFCTHPDKAYGAPCGDPTHTECDFADTCDGAGSCEANIQPDETPCDDENPHTGASECSDGICVGTTTVLQPIVIPRGCRALEIRPQPEDDETLMAFVVTSTEWPCLLQYVQANGILGDTFFEQSAADWGTIIAIGQDLVPDTTYEVTVEYGEDALPPVSASLGIWGDTNHNRAVNLTDILCVINSFGPVPNGFPNCGIPDADLLGGGGPTTACTPNRYVNLTDILAVLDAFRPDPYPCPEPCAE